MLAVMALVGWPLGLLLRISLREDPEFNEAFYFLEASGAALWILSRRLPTDEALEVAKTDRFQGSLNLEELAQELRVTLDTARATLSKLAEMGLARKEMIKDREVWRFPSIRLAPRMPGEAGPWRCSACWTDNRPESLACAGCSAPRQQVEVK